MRKAKPVAKPYIVKIEASHVPSTHEVGRYRTEKEARAMALQLAMDFSAKIQEGTAEGVDWVRTRVFCGPYQVTEYQPLNTGGMGAERPI
jgi:cell division protein FtsN